MLSLFFIDAVEHYRSYDADGNPVKGKYARMFEEEYRRPPSHAEVSQPVQGSRSRARKPTEVHDGYFSIDKKRRWTDTAENNQTNRDNAERAYNLIMKDKEKLLGFETKLKFIFSHSALREGWDNPERLPDMRAPRDGNRTRASPDNRPRPAPLRQPEGRTPAGLRDQHPDRHRDGKL